MAQQTILRYRTVCDQTGYPRSTLYLKIHNREFPTPISLGGRSVGWVSSEVDAVIAAHIAGKNIEQIKHLVERLTAARKDADKQIRATT